MAGKFKSKLFSFTDATSRKVEVRLKHNDTHVATIYRQAGNDSFRYTMKGHEGRQSREFNEKGVVQAIMDELFNL